MKTLLSALPLLVLITLACETKKPTSQTTTATATTTAPADSAAALAKRPGPDGARSAADRLVRALYFEHNKTDNPFRDTKSRATVDQFFAPALADKIWQRVSKAGGKPAKLNGLFNAPDAGITKTWVEPAAVGGSKAVVYVTYLQTGKPAEVRVDLTQQAGRWRITELTYPAGKTLTGQL